MKTLNEYLERNNYNIVKSLMDMLSIDEQQAKDFYSALTLFDESKVIDALKEPIADDKTAFVNSLYSAYCDHTANKETDIEEAYPEETGGNMWDKPSDAPTERFVVDYADGQYHIHDNKLDKIVDTVHSGHEAQNSLYYFKQMAKREKPEVEEAEQLDELSPKTLKSYIGHATGDAAHNAEKYGAFGHQDYADIEKRRHTGIRRALDKLVPDEDDVKESKEVDVSRMASKAAGGGYDMARELAKGQYQPKIVQNKKFKDNRQADKAKLKRGVFEDTITPIIVNENNEYKFKLVETSAVANTRNVEAIFESAMMVSPLGGLSSVPGIGMADLRKMSGIGGQIEVKQFEEPVAGENLQDLDTSSIESANINQVLSIIDYMDEMSKACLIKLLTQEPDEIATPTIDAEQMEMVKCAICDFGSALQCWIEESNGGLDFLHPLVETLWIKYNEFCV